MTYVQYSETPRQQAPIGQPLDRLAQFKSKVFPRTLDSHPLSPQAVQTGNVTTLEVPSSIAEQSGDTAISYTQKPVLLQFVSWMAGLFQHGGEHDQSHQTVLFGALNSAVPFIRKPSSSDTPSLTSDDAPNADNIAQLQSLPPAEQEKALLALK